MTDSEQRKVSDDKDFIRNLMEKYYPEQERALRKQKNPSIDDATEEKSIKKRRGRKPKK